MRCTAVVGGRTAAKAGRVLRARRERAGGAGDASGSAHRSAHGDTRHVCMASAAGREGAEAARREAHRRGGAAAGEAGTRRCGADGGDAARGEDGTTAGGASDESEDTDGSEREEPATNAGSAASIDAGSPTAAHEISDESATDLATGAKTLGNSEGRPKRKRTRADGGEGGTYDETMRRAPRRQRTVRYMARPGRGGAKRDAIQVGAAVVERIVRGRYEWRDGGLRPMTQ